MTRPQPLPLRRLRDLIRAARGAVEAVRGGLQQCRGIGGVIAQEVKDELGSLRRACMALYCEACPSGDTHRVSKLRMFVKESHHGKTLTATEEGTKAFEKALEPLYAGSRYTVLDLAARALELRQEFKDVSVRASNAWVEMFQTLLPEGHGVKLGCFRKVIDIAHDFGTASPTRIYIRSCVLVSFGCCIAHCAERDVRFVRCSSIQHSVEHTLHHIVHNTVQSTVQNVV